MGAALGLFIQRKGQRRLQSRGKAQGGGAAAVNGSAGPAVHLGFDHQPFALVQHANAVGAVKLMGGKAHGIHAVQPEGRFTHGLGGIHMQAAVGAAVHQRGDLPHRLHGAQLTVHPADGNQYGILAQQLFQLFQVNSAIPANVQQIDLVPLLLQGRQCCPHAGMLQRGGDDMPPHMPGRAGHAL